jgi:hypothetical protein
MIVARGHRWYQMYFPISGWFAAFVLTLAIELPIVALLVRGQRPDIVRLAILITFANLATHLAVWYVITQLLLVGTLQYALVAETWAVTAEAAFYWAAINGLSARRAIAVALVANASSFVAGRVVTTISPGAFG